MISRTVSKNPKTQNCLYCLFVFYVNACIHVSGNKKIYKKNSLEETIEYIVYMSKLFQAWCTRIIFLLLKQWLYLLRVTNAATGLSHPVKLEKPQSW